MNSEIIEPSYTLFEGLIGREFSAQTGDQTIRFELIEVSKLSPSTNREGLGIRQDPFSLLFKEITDFQPEQGSFELNIGVGTAAVFLVPVGHGEFEAIFN